MRCASCKAENEDKVPACSKCGAALKPRRPRRRDEVDAPLSPQAEAHNRQVITLYRWCLLALLPVAGLVVGPIVAYRAHRFKARAATDPALAGAIPADFAFWLGLGSGALSWLGLALMALGLWIDR
jgi:hypothetical protein